VALGHVEQSPTVGQAELTGVHHPVRVGYDPNNPKVSALVWFGVWFLAAIVVILAVTWVVYSGITRQFERADAPRSALASQRPSPPEPRLQPSPGHDVLPQVDVREMLDRENAEFQRRGWTVDERTRQPVIPQPIVQQISQLSAPGFVPPNVQPAIPAAPNIAPAGATTRPAQR
jgi:hypothetical protein